MSVYLYTSLNILVEKMHLLLHWGAGISRKEKLCREILYYFCVHLLSFVSKISWILQQEIHFYQSSKIQFKIFFHKLFCTRYPSAISVCVYYILKYWIYILISGPIMVFYPPASCPIPLPSYCPFQLPCTVALVSCHSSFQFP